MDKTEQRTIQVLKCGVKGCNEPAAGLPPHPYTELCKKHYLMAGAVADALGGKIE